MISYSIRANEWEINLDKWRKGRTRQSSSENASDETLEQRPPSRCAEVPHDRVGNYLLMTQAVHAIPQHWKMQTLHLLPRIPRFGGQEPQFLAVLVMLHHLGIV